MARLGPLRVSSSTRLCNISWGFCWRATTLVSPHLHGLCLGSRSSRVFESLLALLRMLVGAVCSVPFFLFGFGHNSLLNNTGLPWHRLWQDVQPRGLLLVSPPRLDRWKEPA